LLEGDFQTRWEVAKAIPHFGAAAIPLLIDLLQDEEADGELAWFVARILGQLNHPQAIAALTDLLTTADDDDVRAIAATTLANFGEVAIPALQQLLADSSRRLLAIRALAQIRSDAVVGLLSAAASDRDPQVRSATLEALIGFPEAAIADLLLAALRDPVAAVRRAAVTGLGLRAGHQTETELLPHLQPLLSDINLAVCQQAVLAVGRCREEAAARCLLDLLQEPHAPEVLKRDAIRSLAWMETATALSGLRQYLQQLPHNYLPQVQLEAIAALGRIESAALQPLAAQTVMEWLDAYQTEGATASAWQVAALALGQLGQSCAQETLIRLLRYPDTGLRLHAIAALKQIDAIAARASLEQLAIQPKLDGAWRQGIVLALAEWGDPGQV
jgi:HEAT repeat protein